MATRISGPAHDPDIAGDLPEGHRRALLDTVLRIVVAAGLAVDASIHWTLATSFDGVRGTGRPHISQGQLFRLEAAMAVVAAVLVLVVRHRWSVGFALLVAAGGVGAVVLYQYVDVGAVGPLPDMYDPGWYWQKTVSAIAEGASAAAAMVWLLPALARRRGGRRR